MSKNIQMQEKTSSGYDILYPQTIAAQIEDVYSKDETITTATKALYGLGATATPNQVFSAISTALDGKARIQTGSYVGTGTYGASNPCSLTFDFEPLYLNISSDASSWGVTVRNDNVRTYYTVYSRGIFYAPNSFSAEWGMGFSYLSKGGRSYGKLNEKTYYWYSENSASYQDNEANLTYYWFCLER